MSGNVWELCQDKWNRGYYDRSPDRNPPGAASGRVALSAERSEQPRTHPP